MSRFELVIFDLDGTLIDNRSAIRENFNHALSLFGYSALPAQQIDAMIGTPLREMFEMVLKESEKQLASKLVDEYQKRYQDTGHEGVVILDSVIQTLEYLKDGGLKLAVATQKADEYAKLVLGCSI